MGIVRKSKVIQAFDFVSKWVFPAILVLKIPPTPPSDIMLTHMANKRDSKNIENHKGNTQI